MEKDTRPTGFYNYLPRGHGSITRKAYTAHRRGKSVHVKRGRIHDMGAPGKWRAVTGLQGIGPLKTGLLAKVGYSVTAKAKTRRAAVKRAVRKYGRASTIRKLNAVATYTKRTSPAKSKKFRHDMKVAQKLKTSE